MAALAEGLGPSIESLVSTSPIVDLLLAASQGSMPADVRQSAFATTGDLARACAPHLLPRLTELAAAVTAQLAPGAIAQETMAACNNAAWAFGELAVRCRPEDLAPQVMLPLLECFASILAAAPGRLPRSLRENAAISLGRCALIVPTTIAPHLSHFLAAWYGAVDGSTIVQSIVRSRLEQHNKRHSVSSPCHSQNTGALHWAAFGMGRRRSTPFGGSAPSSGKTQMRPSPRFRRCARPWSPGTKLGSTAVCSKSAASSCTPSRRHSKRGASGSLRSAA